MEFEWDEQKRETNIRKHDVDFLLATMIFDDDYVEWTDDRKEYGELRRIAVGNASGLILTIVYTLRQNVVRILSARKARQDEQRYYREILSRRNQCDDG